MREIRTSGLMSGEGKRSDANAVQTTAPFLDSTQDLAAFRFSFTINVLVLIWIGFNKTGCFQDALFGLRQTGGVRRLRRRRDHHRRRRPAVLRERAHRIRLFERMAACFTDHRRSTPPRAVHARSPLSWPSGFAGIALGYEDINDHDALRHDPALQAPRRL